MARQGASWDDYASGKEHNARVVKKVERIQGLEALLATHEADPDADHVYVLELRAKLRCAKNQLISMRGDILND